MEILRSCQTKAIENFDNHFYNNKNNKGIISMCCGSGKSRTMYELIKNCENKNEKIFIIATTRVNLIYQLFNDISKWSTLENKSFVIKLIGGSGKKYKKDTLENNIYNIIKNITNPLIIITTYQSSNKIVDAIKGNKELFPDLIILDESHNTTGITDKKNRILIKQDNDDENYIFTSSKYLFMTATPVRLQIKNKSEPYITEGSSYSMDNENIYGKIIYEYSFYEGIKDKILVPFDTIYYIPTKDEIPDEIKLKINNMSKEQKTSFYFETISGFLIYTILTYNLKHILVYLQTKDKADIMKYKLENIINKQNINIYIITSSNTQKEQDKILLNFRTPSKFTNILLSVSIFDEGVDEPCIDSIMFGEERYSEARIVQNIGRCLRLNNNKKKSYVIIPNIVYEYNIDLTNELSISTYSSHYRKIREIISILNKSSKNKFYLKSSNYNDINFNTNNLKNEDLPYQDIKNISENYKSIEQSDIKLSKWFIQVCSNNNISNELLENIKNKILEYKIDSVKEYGYNFINTPYHILHNEFKTEWISWSHILYNTIYSYDEAKEFIKSLDEKFNSATEWNNYYNTILFNELNDEKNISPDIFNNIIKIPNNVKEYYISKWIDWNDFLNLNIEYNPNIVIDLYPTTIDSNSNKNIEILINKDSEKINKFNDNQYNSIELMTDISPIITYIYKELGFKCTLISRILFNINSIYDRICINCYRINNPIKLPLMVIWPELKKIKYDSNLLDDSIMNINRNIEKYIQDIDIIKLCEKIVQESRNFINK